MGGAQRESGHRTGWVLALLPCVWALGCEISRPDGAYEAGIPWERESRQVADIAVEDVQSMDELFDQPGLTGGTTSTPDGGTTDGASSGGTAGGGTGGAGNGLAQHAGDYYFKIVTIARSDGGSNLGTVTSTSRSYGQMRVVLSPDGKLVAEEKLCYLEIEQESSEGAEVQTSTRPGLAQNFQPVFRTFEITGSGWRTDVVRRRQGWRSDLSPDEMPTDPGQVDKFTDPDGDSVVGYRTTVEGSASVGGIISGGRTCGYDVVSFSDTAYEEGSFAADGVSFAAAGIFLEDSKLHALYAERLGGTGTCSTSDLNSAAKSTIDTDRITLVRVDPLADHRACAGKTAYTSAL